MSLTLDGLLWTTVTVTVESQRNISQFSNLSVEKEHEECENSNGVFQTMLLINLIFETQEHKKTQEI